MDVLGYASGGLCGCFRVRWRSRTRWRASSGWQPTWTSSTCHGSPSMAGPTVREKKMGKGQNVVAVFFLFLSVTYFVGVGSGECMFLFLHHTTHYTRISLLFKKKIQMKTLLKTLQECFSFYL